MNVDFTLAGAVIITGLVVVFIALIGLSALVWWFGRLFTARLNMLSNPDAPKTQNTSVQKAPVASAAVKPAMVVEDGINDEIIAVIAAAVAAMGDSAQGFVLRSVRRAKEVRSPWASAGLTQNTQPF